MTESGHRQEGLAPLVGKDPTVLILGSLPSVKSISRQEYYANPTNLFWKVLAGIFGEPVPVLYKDKVAFLDHHRIALWDSLRAAIREGSLDNTIKDGEPNDIVGFIKSNPSIRLIVLNGGESEKAFRKVARLAGNAFDGISVVRLPSTSSMIRTKGYTVESLTLEWKQKLTVYEEIRLQDSGLLTAGRSDGYGERTPETGERGLGTGISMPDGQRRGRPGKTDGVSEKRAVDRTQGRGIYVDLWEKYLPVITTLIDDGGGVCQLSSEEFKERGNRKSYSFTLNISNGIIPRDASKAMSRDLKAVLDASPTFKYKASGKEITIRLDSAFKLIVRVV